MQDPVWSHFAEKRSLVSGSPIRGSGDDWRTGSGELEEGEFLSWYWLQDWLKVRSAGAQKRKCWKGSLASSSKVGEGHYAVRWLGRMLGQVVAAAPLQRECRVCCQLQIAAADKRTQLLCKRKMPCTSELPHQALKGSVELQGWEHVAVRWSWGLKWAALLRLCPSRGIEGRPSIPKRPEQATLKEHLFDDLDRTPWSAWLQTGSPRSDFIDSL